MKNIRLSFAEKKLLRSFILSVLLEIIIILLLLDALNGLYPLKIHDTERVDIIVEDLYYDYGRTSNRLVVSCGSEEYVFHNRSSEDEYSVRQLKEMIAVGDHLSLNYCEERNIWGKYNSIVNAQTESEVYRSIDHFNENQKNGSTIFIIVLVFIELIFCLNVILYIFFNKNTIKSLLRKIA